MKLSRCTAAAAAKNKAASDASTEAGVVMSFAYVEWAASPIRLIGCLFRTFAAASIK